MKPFAPPKFMRGPHAQSLLASTGLRRLRVIAASAGMRGTSRDQVVDCGAGVRLLVHHTPPIDAARGRVAVLIHGWEGSGTSTYVLSAAVRLWKEGFRVIRINLRDHGDSHYLNEDLFHSCRLAEVVGAVKWVQAAFPDEALMLGGFSLGGNFCLRIAADAADAGLQIQRVVAVCPVLDPAQTMEALDTGLSVYRIYFIRRWRHSLKLKKAAFPSRYDFEDLERFDTLREMTDFFVRHYTEFPDLETYLNGYSLRGDRLAGLNVPTKMLLADDDPVIPIRGLEQVVRPGSLAVERSPYGGHCGFLNDYGLSSWLDRYVLEAFDLTRYSRS
jgi:predicted alpha/beta-fold hydrolase